MINRCIHIAFLICWSFFNAQATEHPTDSLLATTENEVVSISGIVTCSDTKLPLINAHVYEDGYLIAITNNAGEFNFQFLM